MEFDEYLQKYNLTFNDEQKAAIRAVDGPVCLLASPGSGKTRTLVARVGYLILCCEVDPSKILVMTYTVAATRDMSERFTSFFGDDAGKVEFRTINGVAQRVINAFCRASGKTAFELISDEKERAKYIRQAYLNVRKEWPTESDIKDVGSAVTLVKNMLYSEKQILQMKTEIREFSKIYAEYQRLLSENRKMDYDDQLVTCYRLLVKVPDLLSLMQRSYEYICLDEAQDTSKVQHEIVALLAGKSRQIFMVGDEDQSIYKFRGAFPEGLLSFTQKYPEGKVLLMEKNYRSDGYIVQAADVFIQKNTERHKKHIVATRSSVNPVERKIIPVKSRQYDTLLSAIRGSEKQVAVLSRNNESLLPVVDRLEEEGIPYNIRQMELSFFTHPVVADIRNFLQLSMNENDAEAFLSVYYKTQLHIRKEVAVLTAQSMRDDGCGLGSALMTAVGETYQKKKAKDFLEALSRIKDAAPRAALSIIMNTLEYDDYLERNHISKGKIDTLRAIAERQKSIEGFLSRLDGIRSILQTKERTPGAKIILSTIHSSKGLEYDSVHLIDCYDGCFPEKKIVLSRASKEEKSVYEEERRLFYVGVTRAKNHLTVYSYDDSTCSFVDEFMRGAAAKPVLIKKNAPASAKRTAVLPEEYVDYVNSMAPGTKVVHKTFGEGVVQSVDKNRATINFAQKGKKLILLDFAFMSNLMRPL